MERFLDLDGLGFPFFEDYLINRFPTKEELTPLIIEHPLEKYSSDVRLYYIDLRVSGRKRPLIGPRSNAMNLIKGWFICQHGIEAETRLLEYESRRIAA